MEASVTRPVLKMFTVDTVSYPSVGFIFLLSKKVIEKYQRSEDDRNAYYVRTVSP